MYIGWERGALRTHHPHTAHIPRTPPPHIHHAHTHDHRRPPRPRAHTPTQTPHTYTHSLSRSFHIFLSPSLPPLLPSPPPSLPPVLATFSFSPSLPLTNCVCRVRGCAYERLGISIAGLESSTTKALGTWHASNASKLSLTHSLTHSLTRYLSRSLSQHVSHRPWGVVPPWGGI